jgi:hypothetical protein
MNPNTGSGTAAIPTKFYAVPYTWKATGCNGVLPTTTPCTVQKTSVFFPEVPIPLTSVAGSGTMADPFTANVALSTGTSIFAAVNIYKFQIVIRACTVSASNGEICTDSGSPWASGALGTGASYTYPVGVAVGAAQTGAWGVSAGTETLIIPVASAPIIAKCIGSASEYSASTCMNTDECYGDDLI